MKMKSLILIFIALGCGLVATIGISQVMERNSRGGSAGMKMEQILVAKGDIGIGATLDANSVQLEEWPAARVPEGSIRSLEEVNGKYPQARFYKGEPILLAKISDKNRTPADTIKDGYRTSTIKVDEDTVMEGIGPGDRVDVMVFLRKNEAIQETGVYPIMKNVCVFSKGAQTERRVDEKTGTESRARTISLMVKPAQAQEIALAAEMGKIRLALRNPKDDPADDRDQVIPISELLNGKATNGDDKKAAVASKAPFTPLVAATPPTPAAGPAAQGPSFVMTVQTPNEIKSYQWGDRNALPTETLLLSMGAGNSVPPVPLPATLDTAPHAPPGTVEGDSKGTAKESAHNR